MGIFAKYKEDFQLYATCILMCLDQNLRINVTDPPCIHNSKCSSVEFVSPGRHSESKMKLASVRGRSASPLDLSLPDRSCSARSLMTFSSAGPSGMRFNSAASSDSWWASLTCQS